MEDVQIKLAIEKALYQIHHLRYQDVIHRCQVNFCEPYIYVNITYLFKLFIFNLDSPLESPKVVHSQPHFPFASIKR